MLPIKRIIAFYILAFAALGALTGLSVAEQQQQTHYLSWNK